MTNEIVEAGFGTRLNREKGENTSIRDVTPAISLTSGERSDLSFVLCRCSIFAPTTLNYITNRNKPPKLRLRCLRFSGAIGLLYFTGGEGTFADVMRRAMGLVGREVAFFLSRTLSAIRRYQGLQHYVCLKL